MRAEARAHLAAHGYRTLEEGFDTWCLSARRGGDLLGAWDELEPVDPAFSADDKPCLRPDVEASSDLRGRSRLRRSQRGDAAFRAGRRRLREVHVHYLHGDDVTATSASRSGRWSVQLGGEISFIAVEREVASRLPTTHDLPTSHWYRVFLPELLPDIDRILYLDADTVALESLAPLWETELGGNCRRRR